MGIRQGMRWMVIGLLLGLLLPASHAATVHVAVASNFAATMKEIAQRFEKKSGHQVKLSFGASGRFYAQILHGAPFDLFLSADQAKPAALEKKGLTLVDSRFTYAVGVLVLWAPGAASQTLNRASLEKNDYARLALANPELAPYGTAALEVLTTLNLVDTTRPKWVQGENIAQTYQFVASGNASLGFVALSQLKSRATVAGAFWRIPANLYAPIRQDVVLLKRAAQNDAAYQLWAFMRSDESLAVIKAHGYQQNESVGEGHGFH